MIACMKGYYGGTNDHAGTILGTRAVPALSQRGITGIPSTSCTQYQGINPFLAQFYYKPLLNEDPGPTRLSKCNIGPENFCAIFS